MCKNSGGCCGPVGAKWWGVACAVLAVGCFSVAIWVPNAISSMLNDGVNKSLVIDAQAQADNTDAYQHYVDPSLPDSTPTYYSVYLFSTTNANAVATQGALPYLVRHGPYVYQKLDYKRNVNFTTNVYQQELVSYQSQTQYVFLPDRSVGAESDKITSANPLFVAQPNNPLWALYGPPGAADFFRYFTTHNVTEWLFGYPNFPGIIGVNENELIPDKPRDIQFVGSDPDQNLIRQYVQYEGQTSLTTQVSATVSVPTWKSGDANRIGGTDATIFQRYLQDGQTIQIYTSSLDRIVTFGNIDGEHVTFKGLDLLHFTIPYVFLQNAANYPPNGDFYMLGYTGVANLTAAGLPDFFVTKPHYLDADPALFGNVTNMDPPSKDLHDTFLNVEPFTGVTMQGAKRLMLSLRLSPQTPTPGTTYGQGLPNQVTGQYLPLYWAEEYAEISDSDASSFKKQVYGAKTAITAVRIAGQAAGAALAVVAVILLLVAVKKAGAGGSGDTSDNRVVPLNDRAPGGGNTVVEVASTK